FDIIQQKQQPQDDAQRKMFRDIVRRLDEGLFRNATSKEEYTNLDTLESRLHLLIKRPSLTNQNQRYPHMVNNNSAIGAMIPTPGMSNSGNSNVMVTGSTDSSMVPTTGSNSIAPTVNTGNIMPTGGIHGGSFNRSDGPVSNGYQQSPANFSMSSGGNISSVGGQRIASQMIPTPGFSGISNQSYTNLESSSNGGGFSTVEFTMVSQPQPQRQHIVGQNNNGGGQNNMLPQLPVMSQQNGNALPQMLNLSGSSRPMDPDFVRARHFMQDKIFDIIQQKQQPQDDAQRKKFRDIVRRLDDGLFRNATSKEEYTNLDTLESRLHLLIKRPSLTNQNQRYPHMVNNNSAIGAMIPTPGMSNSGNSNMMVTGSTDSSMVPTTGSNSIAPTVNTGNIMPTGGIHGGSFNRSDGPVSNGYQPSPANFSMSSGGNISSVGGQRIASQMIPTPGFSGISNQSYTNLESSSNGGGFSTVESTMVSQPQPQRQHIVGQNNRMLHSQMGGGTRSSLQSKPYGFSNGTLNGGMGLMGNNLPLNETGTSEGYLTATSYAYSPKPLQHHFDQHQRPAIQ
ncbi:hypothetical protein UlMin_042154, partial [Ulmus minor]